jgi:hypothetical protein
MALVWGRGCADLPSHTRKYCQDGGTPIPPELEQRSSPCVRPTLHLRDLEPRRPIQQTEARDF